MEMIKITIELPREFHVRLGARTGEPRTVTVDWDKMPQAALAAIFTYGAQRKFNDAAGGGDKTLDDKVKIVEDLRSAFENGQVRKARVSGAGEEPWMPALRGLIRDNLTDAQRKEYKELDADKRNDWLEAVWDNMSETQSENYEEAAKEQHEAEMEVKAAKAARAAKLKLNVKL